MNIKQRRILSRGNNDLMDEAYRELAQTANRMDWIVVGLWIVVIAALIVAASLGAFA